MVATKKKAPTKKDLEKEVEELKKQLDKERLRIADFDNDLDAEIDRDRNLKAAHVEIESLKKQLAKATKKTDNNRKGPITPVRGAQRADFPEFDFQNLTMPKNSERNGINFPVPYDAESVAAVTIEDVKTEFAPLPDNTKDADWALSTGTIIAMVHQKPNDTFKKLLRLQKQGRIDGPRNMLQTRLDEDDAGNDVFRPIKLFRNNNLIHCNLEAAMITIYGIPIGPGRDCKRCNGDCGPFEFCTVLPELFSECNNCHYNAMGSKCTGRPQMSKRKNDDDASDVEVTKLITKRRR